jgi:hypothetical protein
MHFHDDVNALLRRWIASIRFDDLFSARGYRILSASALAPFQEDDTA